MVALLVVQRQNKQTTVVAGPCIWAVCYNHETSGKLMANWYPGKLINLDVV